MGKCLQIFDAYTMLVATRHTRIVRVAVRALIIIVNTLNRLEEILDEVFTQGR
jgi:hypothetical protein